MEAGPDAHDEDLIKSPLACSRIHGTDLEWNYETDP